MFRKTKNILFSFWKSSNRGEILEIYGIPTIIVAIAICFVDTSNISINNFTEVFLESNLTIAALLAAFGVASVTIIMTSSSKNIEVAKAMPTARLNINNIPITYYQLVLIRNYYNIIIQLILLTISVLLKFIINDKNSLIILILSLWLLIHAIFVQLLNVTTMYYLMWKDKEENQIND